MVSFFVECTNLCTGSVINIRFLYLSSPPKCLGVYDDSAYNLFLVLHL